MVFMNPRNYQDRLLTGISSGITTHAAHLQPLDLARLGRGTVVAYRFEAMLATMKRQIARKAALRAGASPAIDHLELQARAA